MQLDIENYPPGVQADFHIIKGHYHYAFDHPKEMYYHRKKALTIIEDLKWEMRIWLTHARFLVIGLSTFKMFEEFDREFEHIIDVINKISIQKRHPGFIEEIENTVNNIKINRDLDQGNFENIQSYIEELEERYGDENLEIDTNLKMVFYFNFAYAQLASGNYKKALKWTNAVLNDPTMRNIRYDVHTYIRILNICTHYALGNYELIKPLVKSTQRYLSKQNRDIKILTTFLKFANNHFCNPPIDSRNVEMENAIKELRVLSKGEEGKIALE